MKVSIHVPNLEGIRTRLDAYILSYLLEKDQIIPSRSLVQDAIRNGRCFVNGNIVQKNGTILKGGEEIECEIILPVSNLTPDSSVEFVTIYEDENLIVINKPAGLLVHPARGVKTSTLVHGILHKLKDVSIESDEMPRPGIVHRLDKDTSGAMVVAKTLQAKRSLQAQLQEPRTMKRVYHALCIGRPKKVKGLELGYNEENKQVCGTIRASLARNPNNRIRFSVSNESIARDAITHFSILKSSMNVSLIEFKLETGRTHQIRVHAEYIGCPILGDPVYRPLKSMLSELQKNLKFQIPTRQMLHATTLRFLDPVSGKEQRHYAPYPTDFLETGRALGLLPI